MAAFDSQGFLAPGLDLDYPYQPSPLYSASTASDLTLVGDQHFTSPHPSNFQSQDTNPRPSKKVRVGGPGKQVKGGTEARKTSNPMPTPDAEIVDVAANNRPKRVRTGCLTCRERHLKCDEGLPDCLNCRKSNRTCKRGVRLNFIDTTVKCTIILPPTADWRGMQN